MVVAYRFAVRDDGIIEAYAGVPGGVLDHALNDAITSRAPRGAVYHGLSTYWIDRTESAMRAAMEQHSEDRFATGNVTYLRLDGDRVVAGSDFDPDDAEHTESIPVSEFAALLDAWRQRVIESGGTSGDAAALLDEPPARPMGPST